MGGSEPVSSKPVAIATPSTRTESKPHGRAISPTRRGFSGALYPVFLSGLCERTLDFVHKLQLASKRIGITIIINIAFFIFDILIVKTIILLVRIITQI